jgi:predicted AlkP superfamily phosphohydrolase/phosphomutase
MESLVARNKVLAIGLDGLPLDLIEPWMKSGDLPFFTRLAQEGTLTTLRTVFPPVTACAWAAITTGCNPGKNGIMEFVQRVRGVPGRQAVNSTFLRAETLWDIFSRHGRRVCVVNIPLSFPPRPVNGILVGDFLTPKGNREFTYPREILPELEERFGPYLLYHQEVYRPGGVGKVLDELFRDQQFRWETGRYLLDKEDWDLFMINFMGTDRLQHELWHVWDTTHPAHDPQESRQHLGRIVEFLREVDRTLALLAAKAEERGAHLVVFSDHGLGPIHHYVNVNIWLLSRGYLHLKRGPATAFRRALFFAGLTPSLVYRAAMHLGLAQLRLKGGLGQRRKLIGIMRRFFLSLDDVDWSRTTAYSQGNYGQIFVNLAGREPEGIVTPGPQCQRLLDRLAGELAAATDPASGRAIVGQVYRREDLYHGPFADLSPDLSFVMADMRDKALGVMEFGSNRFVEPAFGNSGDHRLDGILGLLGPGVLAGQSPSGLHVLDLAPLILACAGVPLPGNLDGTLPTGLFREGFLEGRAIREEGDRTVAGAGPLVRDEEENREIQERLRHLGYLG